MELHVCIPGRPADLVARILNGCLEIVPPAKPAPAPVAQPCANPPAAAPAP